MNATTIDRAIIIMENYIPTFFNSKNYKWNILQIILDNENWTKEMVRFVETHEGDTELYKGLGYKTMITQTLMHDIGGLMSSDEHFLPRI